MNRTGNGTRRNTCVNLAGALAAGAIPVVSLYSDNPSTELFHVVQCIAALCAMSAIVYIIILAFTKDSSKTALGTVLSIVLIFVYGPIIDGLRTGNLEVDAALHFWRLLGYSILVLAYAIGLLALRRTHLNCRALARVVSIVALTTLFVATLHSVWNIRSSLYESSSSSRPATGSVVADAQSPDIYYIVVDSYGRADALEALYGYDNTAFLEELRQRGFYVAGQARTNYTQTVLSLSSSLNSRYLSESSFNTEPLAYAQQLSENMIRHNATVDYLRSRGYVIVNIASGFEPTNSIANADVQLDLENWSVGEFELALLQKTPFRKVLQFINQSISESVRARVLAQFEFLAAPPRFPRPKFVFVHILSPHPPFVFAANGGPSHLEVAPSLFDGLIFNVSVRCSHIQ